MTPLCVSFSLLIEDQGLVGLSAISDPFDSNRFMLCPWAMSFLSKVVPCPFASCYTWGQKKLDTTERLSLHLVLASARLLQSCPAFCDPWTVARQVPLPTGFSTRGYWSGLICTPPGDLPFTSLRL